jgi:hypothetical protein
MGTYYEGRSRKSGRSGSVSGQPFQLDLAMPADFVRDTEPAVRVYRRLVPEAEKWQIA